ncbi:hypothetical protein M8J76_007482 [Diaphorina citri]|nr:hypothetical protein M8J76_007482 [Diaphorina citri]
MVLKNSDEINDESELLHLVNGALQSGLGEKLTQVRRKKHILDTQRQSSPLQRNLVYPAAMVLLLVLTVITVLLVVSNSLGLLIGINALPLSTQQFTLGLSSISALGTLGAVVQTIIILYLIVVSTIGLYSLPKLSWLRPKPKQTPLTYIIANCYFLLLLTSALPVLARMLGVTNFDLLGDFGQIEWLGSFRLVFTYNLIFALVTTLSIVRKFTSYTMVGVCCLIETPTINRKYLTILPRNESIGLLVMIVKTNETVQHLINWPKTPTNTVKHLTHVLVKNSNEDKGNSATPH